jgi:MFS family permease
MPLLVRLPFGSNDPQWKDWQTTLVTAAVPTFMVFSIFWNELLRRLTLRRYLMAFWLVAILPLGCVGFVQNYWQLLACHVIATAGLAGAAPLNGMLLKTFYSDAMRGRIYAVLNLVALGSGIVAVYLLGDWLERQPWAFRLYLPVAALLQLVALALLLWLARLAGRNTGVRPAARSGSGPMVTGSLPSWSTLLRPITRMRQVLRADRTFLRYESAFMTYGAAFMLCDALLPVLATAKLGMRYEEYAHATQVARQLAMLVVTLPVGWLNDRLGPVRTSCAAFAALALYPLLLIFAGGPAQLAAASVVFGLGLAGVQMGWMLGPLNLAGSPEKVPQYVAIHATLVGVRGIFFQGFGMLLYKLTGSFVIPLLVAVGAFLWAAAQMWRLHGMMRQTQVGGGRTAAAGITATAPAVVPASTMSTEA